MTKSEDLCKIYFANPWHWIMQKNSLNVFDKQLIDAITMFRFKSNSMTDLFLPHSFHPAQLANKHIPMSIFTHRSLIALIVSFHFYLVLIPASDWQMGDCCLFPFFFNFSQFHPIFPKIAKKWPFRLSQGP